jgi:hypothetical protein
MSLDCSDNKPYYDDPYHEDAQDVVCENYVRVVCKDRIIQIRYDIIMQSQLFDVLQGGIPAENLSECIHVAFKLGTSKRIKIICDWLGKHLDFEASGTPGSIREEYDRYHFLLNSHGKAMIYQLKDDLSKGIDVLFQDHNKKNEYESKMVKININVLTLTKDEQNNIFKTVIMNEIKNILDPFAEVARPIKYHRKFKELCRLVAVSKFLELHPFKWHTDTGIKINENENMLNQLYPCSQFGYLNIPQRIFCETSLEILLYHIINYLIANSNSRIDLSRDWKDNCLVGMQISPQLQTCNTSTKNDLYNIIISYNYFANMYFDRKIVGDISLFLPQNHASLSFNINNNSALLLFHKIHSLTTPPKYLTYFLDSYNQDCQMKEDITDFNSLFNQQDVSINIPILKHAEYQFAIKCLLILLAYNSSEGKNQRDYRIAYMDNPDPAKKYINGVSGALLTTLKQYDDPHIPGPPPYQQYGGPLDKSLIKHFMP